MGEGVLGDLTDLGLGDLGSEGILREGLLSESGILGLDDLGSEGISREGLLGMLDSKLGILNGEGDILRDDIGILPKLGLGTQAGEEVSCLEGREGLPRLGPNISEGEGILSRLDKENPSNDDGECLPRDLKGVDDDLPKPGEDNRDGDLPRLGEDINLGEAGGMTVFFDEGGIL